MKPITEEEILKDNRFVKWKKEKPVNPICTGYVIRGIRYIPTRQEAMKMNLRSLGLFIAVSTLSMRTAKDAIRNAEHWMSRGRKEIIEQFFPAPKEPDLNDLF